MKMESTRSYLILFCFILWWTTTEIHGQAGICGRRRPVVRFCSDGWLFLRSSVFIGTTGVPENQQNSCECSLSSDGYTHLVFRYLYILNVTNTENMRFEINNMVLNSSADSAQTIQGVETKLAFYTTEQFTTGGVCLHVSIDSQQEPRPDATVSYFNITCSQQRTETNRDPTAVVIVLSVTGALLLTSGVVILLIVVKRCRLVKGTIRNERVHQLSSSDGTRKCQGREKITSGAEHYITMSKQTSNVKVNESRTGSRSSLKQLNANHDSEAYEMVSLCKNGQVQVPVAGQSHEQNRSHIYESMHAPPRSRAGSKLKETVNDRNGLNGKGACSRDGNTNVISHPSHVYLNLI